MTIRERVVNLLSCRVVPVTAGEIAHCLEPVGVKLSSLSSILRRMVDRGELLSFPDRGLRGGNGYLLRRAD